MDPKASLLEQLRIDRAPAPPARAAGGRSPGRLVAIGVGIGLVLLAAAGAALWAVVRSSAVPVRAAVATAAPTLAAEAPVGSSLLDASGYVVAMRKATVSAKGIYKVNEVLVQQGDRVREGQVIARLDDSNTHAALGQSIATVKQLEAALAAARIAAADARPTFLRDQKQLAEGLISPDAFDTAKASYDAAQAAVAVAEQNLDVAKAQVVVNQRFEDDTVIRAPFTGVVTDKSAQPGEIVSPQFSGGGGIVQIVDMDSLEVDVDVSENYISRVRPGQPATITLDAYPDWHIPAEVIAIIPTADRSKATVQVRVGFKQKDPRILPEMGARVSFLAEAPPAGNSSSTGSTAVLVPSAAVVANGDTGKVFVIDGHAVEGRTVRLGARDARGQLILSGLEAGTRVAIGDLARLHDGVRVRLAP